MSPQFDRLYSRVGRAILFMPVAVAGLFGLAMLIDSLGIKMPLDRFLEGGDTRSSVWMGLFDDALRTPLFGEGIGGARFVENSYLLGWVMYGPLMLVLLLLLAISVIFLSLRLRLVRPAVERGRHPLQVREREPAVALVLHEVPVVVPVDESRRERRRERREHRGGDQQHQCRPPTPSGAKIGPVAGAVGSTGDLASRRRLKPCGDR